MCLLALLMCIFAHLWQHDHKTEDFRQMEAVSYSIFVFFLNKQISQREIKVEEEANQWCDDKENIPDLKAWPVFFDVNIVTMASLKLPTWCSWILTWGLLSTAGCPELVVQAPLKPSDFRIPCRKTQAGMVSTFKGFFFKSNSPLVYHFSSSDR